MSPILINSLAASKGSLGACNLRPASDGSDQCILHDLARFFLFLATIVGSDFLTIGHYFRDILFLLVVAKRNDARIFTLRAILVSEQGQVEDDMASKRN